jgi:hypothetical protein
MGHVWYQYRTMIAGILSPCSVRSSPSVGLVPQTASQIDGDMQGRQLSLMPRIVYSQERLGNLSQLLALSSPAIWTHTFFQNGGFHSLCIFSRAFRAVFDLEIL